VTISRRDALRGLVAFSAVAFAGSRRTPVAGAQENPATVRVDYAYYNPSSLVLKKFGWLEEAFQEQGIGVEWVLSAGSNKAN